MTGRNLGPLPKRVAYTNRFGHQDEMTFEDVWRGDRVNAARRGAMAISGIRDIVSRDEIPEEIKTILLESMGLEAQAPYLDQVLAETYVVAASLAENYDRDLHTTSIIS